MKNHIKLDNVINTKEKTQTLIRDMQYIVDYLVEANYTEWFIIEFIEKKLDMLNKFIKLEKPYKSDLSLGKILYIKSYLWIDKETFRIKISDIYSTKANCKY